MGVVYAYFCTHTKRSVLAKMNKNLKKKWKKKPKCQNAGFSNGTWIQVSANSLTTRYFLFCFEENWMYFRVSVIFERWFSSVHGERIYFSIVYLICIYNKVDRKSHHWAQLREHRQRQKAMNILYCYDSTGATTTIWYREEDQLTRALLSSYNALYMCFLLYHHSTVVGKRFRCLLLLLLLLLFIYIQTWAIYFSLNYDKWIKNAKQKQTSNTKQTQDERMPSAVRPKLRIKVCVVCVRVCVCLYKLQVLISEACDVTQTQKFTVVTMYREVCIRVSLSFSFSLNFDSTAFLRQTDRRTNWISCLQFTSKSFSVLPVLSLCVPFSVTHFCRIIVGKFHQNGKWSCQRQF